jgi:hypothetical protein
MSWCEYRYEKKRRVPGKKPKRTFIGIERYVNRVKAGSGSQSFKQWLSSRPMDAFVIKIKSKGLLPGSRRLRAHK